MGLGVVSGVGLPFAALLCPARTHTARLVIALSVHLILVGVLIGWALFPGVEGRLSEASFLDAARFGAGRTITIAPLALSIWGVKQSVWWSIFPLVFWTIATVASVAFLFDGWGVPTGVLG